MAPELPLPTSATPESLAALATELRELLGDLAVSDEEAALDRASVDGSHLSPIISAKLPLGAEECTQASR